MSYKILVTGGAGFIASNFIRRIIGKDEIEVFNLDALTYAGNLANLDSIQSKPNYHFIKGNILDPDLIDRIISEYHINSIINFAAESHVDRSIMNSRPFLDTNVAGTINLLEAARKHDIKKFIQISTDEVYGSLGADGQFSEDSQIKPNSPYSASKAAADHFVMSYYKTFNVPVMITRCSNNYGPYQFPEKLIPLMILNALENKQLPVYGDGMNVRDWIHVDDHCDAIWAVFKSGKIGEIYNIGSDNEQTNINIVKLILEKLNMPESLIEFVNDRPGHDRRYAIDSTKIENELNWKPEVNFAEGITKTIDWYLSNQDWWENIRSGDYMDYYKEQYKTIK